MLLSDICSLTFLNQFLPDTHTIAMSFCTLYPTHMGRTVSPAYFDFFQEVNSDRTVWHPPEGSEVIMGWSTFSEGGEEFRLEGWPRGSMELRRTWSGTHR